MADNQQTLDEITKAIKGLRRESFIKDILIAIVPLLVAGISIYFSNSMTQAQLEFNREIESAKIIESFSEKILRGGEEAQLAQIAFETVPLTEQQRENLALLFESKSAADAPVEVAAAIDGPQTAGDPPSAQGPQSDTELAGLLAGLFDPERTVRSDAYWRTEQYLTQASNPELLPQMFAKIWQDPFNIPGRSNVLAITADLPPSYFAGQHEFIRGQLGQIEDLAAKSPAYAVGPQTTGWISQIRAKISL